MQCVDIFVRCSTTLTLLQLLVLCTFKPHVKLQFIFALTSL